MASKKLFDVVKKLNLPIGKYALFGSAQLGVQGLRGCQDIDIITTEDLWNKYKNKSEWELRKSRDGSNYLWNNNVELWKDWGPGKWDVQELIQSAEIIDELPFVRIERVIEWKKLYGREKDLKDIELLENLDKNN